MSFDYFEAEQEAAEEAFWENVPKELHEGSVREYLGCYGDAIDARIKTLTDLANRLHVSGDHAPALTVATTCLEVMIQYFCVRPIVSGAFLSYVWASTLSKWIVQVRVNDQRQILIGILRIWNIDLNTIKLSDGKRGLWQTIHDSVLPIRNKFVHRGDLVTADDSSTALECSECFRREVVSQIAAKLGFTLERTGKWAHVLRDNGGIEWHGAGDPFGDP